MTITPDKGCAPLAHSTDYVPKNATLHITRPTLPLIPGITVECPICGSILYGSPVFCDCGGDPLMRKLKMNKGVIPVPSKAESQNVPEPTPLEPEVIPEELLTPIPRHAELLRDQYYFRLFAGPIIFAFTASLNLIFLGVILVVASVASIVNWKDVSLNDLPVLWIVVGCFLVLTSASAIFAELERRLSRKLVTGGTVTIATVISRRMVPNASGKGSRWENELQYHESEQAPSALKFTTAHDATICDRVVVLFLPESPTKVMRYRNCLHRAMKKPV